MAKDYEAIAKEKIHRPSELPETRKILIYSRNKLGKTTLCITAPNVLIADPEHGTDPYIKADPPTWPITEWDDIDEYYNFLALGNHSYEWAALDGITKMHNMALKKVMKLQEKNNLTRIPGLVRRQDYGKANELTKEMLYSFLNLPMGVIMTCQERKIETEVEDAEGLEAVQIERVPDLPRGARAAINEVADLIGRLYIQRLRVRIKSTGEIREVNQRRLHIGPHDNYDTGYRSSFRLPEVVKSPTIPKLVSLLMSGEAE